MKEGLKASLARLIRSRDGFGHRIDVTYKGRETHTSITGGVFTILLQLFTGFIAVNSLIEVFEMRDPKISSF